jgi:hypothetical protein
MSQQIQLRDSLALLILEQTNIRLHIAAYDDTPIDDLARLMSVRKDIADIESQIIR